MGRRISLQRRQQHIITQPLDVFSWDRDADGSWTLVAEASDVAPYEIPGAFRVLGRHKTFQFNLYRVEKREGEIVAWHYRTISSSLEVMELVLLND